MHPQFDVFKNEFNWDGNHFGIDIKSIKSNVTISMGLLSDFSSLEISIIGRYFNLVLEF